MEPEGTRHLPFIYEVFPGNSRFLCRGRVIIGPELRHFAFGFVIIVSHIVLFFLALWSFLLGQIGLVPTIILVCLWTFGFINFLLTGSVNPGILPRSKRLWAGSDEPRAVQSTQKVLSSGKALTLQFCRDCDIFRPPRSTHCHSCGNCVQELDHHCNWVGQCVGKYNYRYFYLFILSSAVVDILFFSLSVWAVFHRMHEISDEEDNGFVVALYDNPFRVPLMLLNVMVGWSLVSLTVFHTNLLLTNRTTLDYLKRITPPVGKSRWRMILHRLFGELPIRLLRPRERVVPPVPVHRQTHDLYQTRLQLCQGALADTGAELTMKQRQLAIVRTLEGLEAPPNILLARALFTPDESGSRASVGSGAARSRAGSAGTVGAIDVTYTTSTLDTLDENLLAWGGGDDGSDGVPDSSDSDGAAEGRNAVNSFRTNLRVHPK